MCPQLNIMWLCTLTPSNISIDATDSTRKGRYCNDCWRKPNAVVKKIIVDKQPKLAIFANCNIMREEEVRFNYGQPDAHWRKVATTEVQ